MRHALARIALSAAPSLLLFAALALLLSAAGCCSRAPAAADPAGLADVRLFRGQGPRCPYVAVGSVAVETTLPSPVPDPTSRRRLEQKLIMEVRTHGGHAAIDLQEAVTGDLLSLSATAIRFTRADCRD